MTQLKGLAVAAIIVVSVGTAVVAAIRSLHDSLNNLNLASLHLRESLRRTAKTIFSFSVFPPLHFARFSFEKWETCDDEN